MKSNREESIMKARHIIIPVLAVLFSACAKEPIPAPEEKTDPVEEKRTTTTEVPYTFSILASRSEEGTKALELVPGTPDHINTYWAGNEKVKVYKDGTPLGMLDTFPEEGEKPSRATLSGSFITSGLAENDELALLIPRETWDYTGQTGVLTGSGNVEGLYAYAMATVTITAIAGNAVTTTNASFHNLQSIYRFGFKRGGSYIDPKAFTVSAAGGKLVQSMSWGGSDWAVTYGSLTVNAASAPADHFFYVSIRNDQTTEDTYNFVLTGDDDALYVASKVIPASVLDVTGKFISAKTITATQPDFSPSSGEITDSQEVL
ncbi:MAG: hypothetical protein J6P56_01820 [Bacteroidales bacterium]|nr:hypothetical protein [Bacteroidales bacterium]